MTTSSVYTLKYQQLLRDLKNTVEGLLVTQVANVWSIYGGLNRLHSSLDMIFKYGCRWTSEEGGFLNFIQGLEWLQPESSKSCFSLDCEYKPHIPSHIKDNKCSIWIYRSLENHSLSQKLSWLLSDKTHLLACYYPYGFLCQEEYAEATLICLRAVERNQPSLISEINPSLFLYKTSSKDFHKTHRRCSSFPDNHLKKIYEEKKRMRNKTIDICDSISVKENKQDKKIHGKLKPWYSMPSLQTVCLNNQVLPDNIKVHLQCKTTPCTPTHQKKISPNMIKVDYNSFKCTINAKKSSQSQKVRHVMIDNHNIIEHTPQLSSSQSSRTTQIDEPCKKRTSGNRSPISAAHSPLSMVEYSFLPMPGEKDYRNKPKRSFIEDGGMSVLPGSTGYFPKPMKGQTLTSFLTSSHFARTNAELDRENAHFSISEAIISAMEQIKCKRDFKLTEEQFDDSDPEILDLKQRIRLRRRQKIVEKQRKQWTSASNSYGKTDTATTVSPCSTPPDSLSEFLSSDDVDDLEIDQASNLTDKQGLSMSMASLYSDADIARKPRSAPDGASDILSAEGVALSLISKFNEKHLPRASDLEWLVSEEDAPQALLPLPKSWPVSPEILDDSATPLRGTQEWAPPRTQIIFTAHPSPSRKILMEKQNYRCAGCSMRVAPRYASKFRYCEYLGKYFCTGCHKNQVSLIPGRILQKWDFNRYPVSTFSYRLLEQMYCDPLFRIFELNKNVTKLSKNLEFCRRYRLGLYLLRQYIVTCRLAESIQERLDQDLPEYFLSDTEVYSIEDLVSIKNNEMKVKLKYLVEICCRHTSECKLCLARGFICEICNANEVIFPWQLRVVTRCVKCNACYHSKCWKPQDRPCVKCVRISKRKESLASAITQDIFLP